MYLLLSRSCDDVVDVDDVDDVIGGGGLLTGGSRESAMISGSAPVEVENKV